MCRETPFRTIAARSARPAAAVTLALASLAWPCAWAQAQEPAAPRAAEAAEAVAEADAFLARARRPFLEQLWGAFTGKVQCRGRGRDVTVPVRVALRFTPDSLFGEIALPENQVYHVQQHYNEEEGGVPKVLLRVPAKPGAVTLDELGVKPEDITFCFLYWRFERELAPETVRGQPCRVLDLAHPQRPERVRAWLARDLGFPLRVQWYEGDEQKPGRMLEFREFKRYGDFWFPKSLRLAGDGWKTQVTFTEADVYRPGEKPEPTHLFQVPPPEPPPAPADTAAAAAEDVPGEEDEDAAVAGVPDAPAAAESAAPVAP
jgi:hypothetical protein